MRFGTKFFLDNKCECKFVQVRVFTITVEHSHPILVLPKDNHIGSLTGQYSITHYKALVAPLKTEKSAISCKFKTRAYLAPEW